MMTHLEKGCLSIAILALTVPISLSAEELKSSSDVPAATETNLAGAASANARKIVYQRPDPTRKLQYRPPLRGAPSVRVTAGSRDPKTDGSLSLSVLAPAHVGLTTKSQPSLFWYQSKPAEANFELTLMEGNQIKPLLQVKLDSSKQDGIQRLRLADHKIHLALKVEYQWVVALVPDAANRSRDVVASGYIKRVAPSEELATKLKKAAAADMPFAYAEEGIWYDALEALSDQIDAAPNDRTLRELRSDLLHQVELDQAALFDAKLVAGK